MRYSRGGCVLWPQAELPSLQATCQRCQGAVRFELQLMPALMPMLSDAVAMLSEDSTVTSSMCAPAQAAWLEWEWLTVAVFTCSVSCRPAGSRHQLLEEHVAVACEEEWVQRQQAGQHAPR